MLSNLRFHHIGMAVKSIEATSALYVQAGYTRTSITYDSVQNVNICWLSKTDMPMIELLAPVDDNSPVCMTLKKNGVSPYHICYEVEDMSEAITELRKMKYVLVSNLVEAPAIQNSKVCFMHHKQIGLIELVESPANITM